MLEMLGSERDFDIDMKHQVLARRAQGKATKTEAAAAAAAAQKAEEYVVKLSMRVLLCVLFCLFR